MTHFKLARWTEVKGRVVRWGNLVGPYAGQSGAWTFSNEQDARDFAKWAAGDPAPPMGDVDLVDAGLALPVSKAEH